MRSRAAASILARAGFNEIYSMEGGIRAWKGLVARGVPDAGMAHFAPGRRPEELMALAWLLEDGSQKFYAEVARGFKDPEARKLFQELGAAEESHKSTLLKRYLESSGQTEDPKFPESVIPVKPGEDYMEGGVRVREAVQWAKKSQERETLELSLSLEVNAQDLYLKMERAVEDPRAQWVFRALSEEEKRHLDRLTLLFEKGL